MVVGTHTLPDPQNACAEAKVLRERLKVAARHLDVWLLLVFELVSSPRPPALTWANSVEGLKRLYFFV